MAKKNGRLGERIRAARAERGWKQKHLAAEVSVEPITVSRWERGATTPDLEVLRLVAGATGKPLSFFVDEGAPSAQASPGLADAATRIEAAAGRIAEESERLAVLLSELVEELRAARSGS
ncbi:MAG TPA: helix-turn-helix transcriptional regulator [Gaiellaceae bacterium]|nr:helix-turn-helix transcriptional regulator [Gaiellaceae bacterium]